MQTVTFDELRNVIALKDASDELLQWILERSDYEEHEDGCVIVKTGDPMDHLWIVMEGEMPFYMDINGREVFYYNFKNDELSGGIGGVLPYSRMTKSPGYGYASGKVRALMLHKKHFHDLEMLFPDFVQRLIAVMTDRARYFATLQLQQEKVAALGQLAAGIAHELNNPAAAINRTASELTNRLMKNYTLTEKLLEHHIIPEQIRSIRMMVENKSEEQKTAPKLSALQRMEKEDELADWLYENGMDEHHIIGETCAEAGLTTEDLEKIKNDVPGEALLSVLLWMENLLSSGKTLSDLDEASNRISILVGAIKSHVHMDRSGDLQPTNIHEGIENTLTLLGHKLRKKNITVKKNFKEDLPPVKALVGELNQVWTNIMDNAIHAMDENGELTITTSCSGKFARASIMDNGYGIPPENKSRIFDPFFTTKKVGEGTGIGLDIVYRIIKRHEGEINVKSEPGRTEFIVCIPMIDGNKNA